MNKRVVPIAIVFFVALSCLVILPDVSFAAHKHKYTDGSSRYGSPRTRVVYECTSSTPQGSPITGGWMRKSDVQGVYYGESASNIAGKSFTTIRTVSFNVSGTALKGVLEAKLGCTKKWKNSTYSATAKNSSRNKTNVARYIAFFTQSSYQKYKMAYNVKNQKYCLSCKKWITQSTSKKTAYAYKKIGTSGAFFYADKKSSLTAETKVCLYKDGIKYEDYSKDSKKPRGYLSKNGSILTGPANKNNQNYNAFSNIKNWY